MILCSTICTAIPFDLLLLDLNFTGADGFQLCSKIKKRYPAMKIAVVTAFGGVKTVHQARKSFVDGFFTKGLSYRQLLNGLHQIMKAPDGSFITIGEGRQPQAHDAKNYGNPELHDKLSKREREIMSMLADGKKNSEIAKQLSISYDTVKTHRSHILNKLGMRNVTELIKYALLTS